MAAAQRTDRGRTPRRPRRPDDRLRPRLHPDANSWKPIAEQFVARGLQAVVVDLPGHGGSANVRADLRRTADMVAQLGGEGTYVGYSLGGRVCLHLALMYPHLVKSLVVIGAHPGIADADERMARREADDALAEHLLDVGVEAFLVSGWPTPVRRLRPARPTADRLRNTPDGSPPACA
jgi:pimeloyl-ACP methyl ester carboxylesterase